MIVNIRLDVSEEERSALSLRLHPAALKRLATRNEIKEYMDKGWQEITAPASSESLAIDEMLGSALTHGVGALKVEAVAAEDMLVEGFTTTGDPQHDGLLPIPSVPFNVEDQKSQQGKTGLRPALASINNAMFSLANVRRQLDNETWLYILAKAKTLVDGAEDLRATLVELHDEEEQDGY